LILFWLLFIHVYPRRYTLIDPNSDEERLMDGFVSVSMNQHREICGIHMGGKLGLKREQVEICKKLAFNKVLELTDRIRQVVADYYK
jgi:exosome complex component RRP45